MSHKLTTFVELFYKPRGITDTFRRHLWSTYTVGISNKHGPNLVSNVLDFNKTMLPKEFRKPDVLWISPPCHTFSMAGNSWSNGYPITAKSYLGMALAFRGVELLRELNPKVWFIENPMGGLRSAWFMKPLPRYTITLCQYGADNMKPTDIWTNVEWSNPKRCNNYDPCHVAAPRGSRHGTQDKSRKNKFMLPDELCETLFELAQTHIIGGKKNEILF